MNTDRNDLNTLENSMNELARELDGRMATIKEKERKLMEI
jgi:cell division protein ZapA (FtsZ GTPase activity inhibitor)